MTTNNTCHLKMHHSRPLKKGNWSSSKGISEVDLLNVAYWAGFLQACIFSFFWGGGDSPQNQLDKLIRPGGPSVTVFNASFALIVHIVRTSVRYQKPCMSQVRGLADNSLVGDG